MARKNKPLDVFKHIDMSGGSEACWPWKQSLDKGRPYFRVDGVRRLAYRIAYELTYGKELDTSTMLLHQCDYPACCNPKHLKEGTHEENMAEMKERDRHGIPHHAVRGIRHLLDTTSLTHREIADRYGIARETVTAIANKRRRSDVQ